MNGYYKQVKRLLQEHGWEWIRQVGSHEIWHKQGHTPVTLSVNCKSRHTANGILKDAGIKTKI